MSRLAMATRSTRRPASAIAGRSASSRCSPRRPGVGAGPAVALTCGSRCTIFTSLLPPLHPQAAQEQDDDNQARTLHHVLIIDADTQELQQDQQPIEGEGRSDGAGHSSAPTGKADTAKDHGGYAVQ